MAAAFLATPAPGSAATATAASAESASAQGATRIPGTWMRLGDTEGHILARANFPPAEGPKGRGVVLRKGPAIWFGLPGEVTLQFRSDRLERVEYAIDDVAPHSVDYLRDQLRMAGYRPRCEQDDPWVLLCDWLGAANVRLESRQGKVLVKVTPLDPLREAVPARAPSRPPARRDTVPVFPQLFILGRATPAGVRAPALVDSTPLVSPPYPARARAAGVQGRVWVRALVDTNGAVTATEVVRSIPELDSAAVSVARRCRFRPYVAEGSPVRFRVEIPVIFMAR